MLRMYLLIGVEEATHAGMHEPKIHSSALVKTSWLRLIRTSTGKEINKVDSFAYFLSVTFALWSLSAFKTTETELNAMAAPATQGAKSPEAAIGIPMEL